MTEPDQGGRFSLDLGGLAATVLVIGLLISALVAGLAGLGLVGFQSYLWLKEGVWYSMSVLDGLRMVFQWQWLSAPEDWVGLYKALSYVPLSLPLLCAGGIYLLVVSD